MIRFLIILLILMITPPNYIGLDYETSNLIESRILKQKQNVDTEWELFILALTWIESTHVPDTINRKSGAIGLFQIMPKGKRGYLDEANRILSEERYTNDDCVDPKKAREIFDVVQNHRNPKKSINRAIKLHNPNAGDWYGNRIYAQMERQEWLSYR